MGDQIHRKRNKIWQGLALELLATGRELKEVLTAVVREVEDQFDESVGSILLLDPDGRHLRQGAAPGLPAEYNRAIDGVEIGPAVGSCGTAVYRREPVIVEDIATDPLWANFRELALSFGLRACWSQPIFSSDKRVLGSFAIYPKQGRKPTPSEIKLIESAAHLVGVAIERHVADATLRASERRFRNLIETAEEGVWIIDLEAKTTFVNAKMTKLLGYSTEEMVGKHLFDFMDDAARKESEVNLARRKQGIREQHEFRLKRKDGSTVWTLMSTNAIHDEQGNYSGALAMVTDITDRKQWEIESFHAKEAAEAANKAKDQFISVLSHELRTPLTPVLLTVQMMETDPTLSKDQRESLDVIRRNVELEARLIDDLLDLTRIAKGKLEMHWAAVDLHQTILNVIQICDNDIRSKQLKLTLELTADFHQVQADTARIQQVLWNILKNATKFTPEGGHITIRTNNPSADRLAVAVRDTGIGIEPNILPKIFDAFEQGDKRITRQFGGLGLGLAISKGLVNLHGGTLSVESEGKDRGATFTLELSTTKSGTVDSKRNDSGHGITKQSVKRHILLVEDHVDTARATARLLTSAGYDVSIATCVAEALRATEVETFDAMISDIGLPDGTGLDLMRQLQAKRPIKAIAISGFGMEDDIRKSKEVGFIDHLVKPVDFSRLVKLLGEICA